jgi:hypothetical protein
MFLKNFPSTFIALIHDSDKTKPVINKTTLKRTDIPAGYGAFFTVNGFKGARKKENLTHISGVFADIDQKQGKASLQDIQQMVFMDLPPTFINETKNGWHLIWLLREPITEVTPELIKTVEAIHRRFVAQYGADNAAVDVGHLLRIPGTEHRKNPADPFVIKTAYSGEDKYTLEELVKVYDPIIKEDVKVEYGQLTDDMQVRLNRMLEKPNISTLWNGNIPEGQQSESDMSLCCHLAFWLAKDPNAMEQAWLQSPLGKRDKVQKRADYRKVTIDKAIALTGEVYTPSRAIIVQSHDDTIPDIDEGDLMTITKNAGKDDEYEEILANDENIIRILSHYRVAKYDLFKNKAYLRINNEWFVRDDGSDGRLFSWLVKKFPFLAKVQVKKVSQMITVVQYRHTFDSAQDYLNSLTWDGVSRLDNWLHEVFYVEKDKYHQEVGRKWWMGLASRIIEPGRKFDNVLIIQGGQSVGKSSTFLTIAGGIDNHVEFTDLKVREMQQDMQGKLIVEFAEAAIFSKADSESLKSIVSRQSDTFRIPYEAHPRDFPRRCAFAVSANNDDILKDSTGGRRWWVVDLPDDMKVYPPKRQANIVWLMDNRDQLFAEAAYRVRTNEEFWEIDNYELQKRQKAITATEQDEDLFYNWYHTLSAFEQNRGISVRQAYCQAYRVDYRGERLDETTVSIKKADEMRVSRILKKIGLEKRHTMGGKMWFPGEGFDRNFAIKFPKTVHETEGENF